MDTGSPQLWPMSMGACDPENRVYKTLLKVGKLIDCHMDASERSVRGIKYSCIPVA
jgi:hypothetical protein